MHEQSEGLSEEEVEVMDILQMEPVGKDILPLDHRHHGASRLYRRELIVVEIGRLEDMAVAVIHIP